MTTCIVNLAHPTTLLPKPRDSSHYISRPIPAPPPLWLQKHTDLRAHDFAHSPDLWHQSRLANVTGAWNWRLCGITPVINAYISVYKFKVCRWQDSAERRNICKMKCTYAVQHSTVKSQLWPYSKHLQVWES